jgi:hypothetical protein
MIFGETVHSHSNNKTIHFPIKIFKKFELLWKKGVEREPLIEI